MHQHLSEEDKKCGDEIGQLLELVFSVPYQEKKNKIIDLALLEIVVRFSPYFNSVEKASYPLGLLLGQK